MRKKPSTTLAESLIKAAIMLLFYACSVLWEFTINPAHNYSLALKGGQVATVTGLRCKAQAVTWNIAITNVWYSSKNHHARLAAWNDNTKPFDLTLDPSGFLKLPGCAGTEMVEVAYVWEIKSDPSVHLRIHPQFEVYIDRQKTPVPRP